MQDFDRCLHREPYVLTKIDFGEATPSKQADQLIIAQLLSNQVFRHGMLFLLKMVHRLLLYKQCSKLKEMSQGNDASANWNMLVFACMVCYTHVVDH